MRNTWKIWLASALMSSSLASFAQTPAAAPAAPAAPAAGMQTFVCKDGNSVSAATSKGACKGHKGIDKSATAKAAGGAAPAAAPVAPAAPAVAPAAKAAPAAAATAAPAAAKSAKNAPAATPAPGGGPGMVWVNENTKVYHCQGDRYYGTTKSGKYMSEADAKAAGAHASKNKACS